MRSGRALTAVLATLLVVGATLPAAAVARVSQGCMIWPTAGELALGVSSSANWYAGEVLTARASPTQEPVPTAPAGTPVQLLVDGVVVDTSAVGGRVMTYTVPADVRFAAVTARVAGTDVTVWTTTCTPALDADADGVADRDDRCPGTPLPDGATRTLKPNRYATDGLGRFLDGRGDPSGYTLADTGGCSLSQIVSRDGLSEAHLWFGISRRALEQWVASIG